ncbi:MAG: VTT domain-containing protein [Gammaproteobacteria bacterium]|nr:VTT domain-containing protein [Gammaproteobacteria bacterium]
MSTPKLRIFLNGLILLVSLVAVLVVFEKLHLTSMLDKAWIDHEVRGHGLSGELLFLAMGAFAIAIGIPRQVISFLAGYAFDLVLGTLLGVTATVAGCMLTLYYARWFGRGLLPARLSGRIHHIAAFIHDHTFSMTLLIRLLPAGSNLVTNLAAGVTRVRVLPFVLGSALGYVPQTLVFALAGSGVGVDPLWRLGLGIVLFLVSGALGIYLYRRFRRGRHLDVQLEHEFGLDD